MKYLFTIASLLLLLACNNNSSKKTEQQTSPTTTQTQEAPKAATPQGKAYPGVPTELVKNLWDNAEFIDYTFYELPISMSFDNKTSIQTVLKHVSSTPAVVPPNCKPTGRAYFQKQGDDLAAVEFYILNGCNYYIFIEDGKSKYGNVLTEEGIQFYQNSINQAMGQMKQQMQQQGQ